MERFCPNCSAPVREGAKFCRSCGTRVAVAAPAEIFCEECGAKNPADAPFCDECGARLTADPSAGDVSDAWGDALASLTAAEEEERLAPFEYERRPDGSVIITGLLDKYAVNLEIPEGVTVIAEGAFAETRLIKVRLPEGLTTVDRRAFFNCNNLAEVLLPSSLLIVGDEAFAECERLELSIPSSVSSVGEDVLRNTKPYIRERDARERAEAERREAERIARERAEAERREAERIARERAEAERREAEKAAREREAAARERAEQRAKAEAAANLLREYAYKDATLFPESLRSAGAIEWLKEKAPTNYFAAVVLAKCYLAGCGTGVNREEAARLLRRLKENQSILPSLRDEVISVLICNRL